jgi:hypothetical protein
MILLAEITACLASFRSSTENERTIKILSRAP